MKPLEFTIEKVEVKENPDRKLNDEWKLIRVRDLSPEDYIEYMEGVFDEAKEHLAYGRVSVDDEGGISVIGWGAEEALTELLTEELLKDIQKEIEVENKA